MKNKKIYTQNLWFVEQGSGELLQGLGGVLGTGECVSGARVELFCKQTGTCLQILDIN